MKNRSEELSNKIEACQVQTKYLSNKIEEALEQRTKEIGSMMDRIDNNYCIIAFWIAFENEWNSRIKQTALEIISEQVLGNKIEQIAGEHKIVQEPMEVETQNEGKNGNEIGCEYDRNSVVENVKQKDGGEIKIVNDIINEKQRELVEQNRITQSKKNEQIMKINYIKRKIQ